MNSLEKPPLLVVLTAAGRSERFGGAKKELASVEGGSSVLDKALSPFIAQPGLAALVITSPAGREGELRAALSVSTLASLEARLGGRFAIVAGGPCRRDSVRLGLEALAAFFERGGAPGASTASLAEAVVLVHDGARPWASADLVARVAAAAAERGAAVPVVPLVDTPKELGPDGLVARHPSRASMGGAQTPQGFRFGSFLAAQRRAAAEGLDCTDDAELWDRYVGPVAFVPGEAANKKVTFASDLPAPPGAACPSPGEAAGSCGGALPFRIGQGWDLHELVAGRRLLVGGVEIPSDRGEKAHSDGDVLLHAIIDALLGAAALGDIGTHFPPSDERWRDADSRELARATAAMAREAGYRIGNLDCTVVLERPRLGPFREAIRASLAACLGVPAEAVSFKAKTKEGLDAVGEGRAVEACAIVTLFRA